MGTVSVTMDASRESADRAEGMPRAYLSFAFNHRAPATTPSRIALHGFDGVDIGRGNSNEASCTQSNQERRCVVTLDDRLVSKHHARIDRVADGWCILDMQSKNGSCVDGAQVESTPLKNGSIIQVGATFVVFRLDTPERDACGCATGREADGSSIGTLVPSVERELAQLGRIAPTELPVLVQGEAGTGKERLARLIHTLSKREGPFVAVSCGALPASLLESELFGYRKGAFSGANEDRLGLFRSAHKGTLLLDEIGDLPPAGQLALLRAIQEREVLPVGAVKPVPVDLRVVAATHRDLQSMVSTGAFRADLYARLCGHSAVLSPLRERKEDLGLLLQALARRHGIELSRLTMTTGAARMLFRHDWPANVRELEHAMLRAVSLAEGGPLEPAHFQLSSGVSERPRQSSDECNTRRLTDGDLRRAQALEALLYKNAGNISAVAREMGKARTQIQRWIKRYGLDPSAFV